MGQQVTARGARWAAVAAGLGLLLGCGGIEPPGGGGTGTDSPGTSDTGTGGTGTDSPGSTAEPPTALPASDPVDLVNLWRVSGAEGEEPDTWLRLDAGHLTLWRGCGILDGTWDATSSAFIAGLTGGSGECVGAADDLRVPWLEAATAYRPAGEAWELLDAEGAVVAELTVDGAPEPIDTVADEYAEPPEVTEEIRASFGRREPLPEGATPASARDLLGRWVPADGAPNDPYAEFLADGTWRGSDGCNGGGGRWRADHAGALLVTAGPTTLMGCAGAPVPRWVGSAGSAAIDDDALVLYDHEGELLGELVRD